MHRSFRPRCPRLLVGMLALLPGLTGLAAEPSSVLVRGNTIAAVGAGALPANPAVTVIDGRGER